MHAFGERRWFGRAFGLSISSAFELPGLAASSEAPLAERPIALDLRPPGRTPARERLTEWRDAAGAVTVAIDRLDLGYRFFARGAGVYELAANGRRASCDPAPGSGWAWRQYLVGQVLPFAAVLQGLEVFHASAVEIDGGAVALAGSSGTGKSTLALHLHLAGAGFVTDDVLAVELGSDEVVVHPGLPTVKLRRAAHSVVDRNRLGALVNSDADQSRHLTEPLEGPVPLATFCLLDRSTDGSLRVEEATPSPLRLLASTFNLVVETPQRLDAHLSVCAAVARRARVLSVAVPDWPEAADAAQLRMRLQQAPALAV